MKEKELRKEIITLKRRFYVLIFIILLNMIRVFTNALIFTPNKIIRISIIDCAFGFIILIMLTFGWIE